MLSQVVLVVSCLVAGTLGFYGPFGLSGGSSQPLYCTSPNKPCSLQVTMRSFNGSELAQIYTQSCRCVHPNTCSSDWSLSDHVISRNLYSPNYIMTFNMMFCSPVQPQEYCNDGEISLEVSGSMDIPTNLVSYNCRCHGNDPLILKQRKIGTDHLVHQTYVCDQHMPNCGSRTTRCLTERVNDAVVDYHCQCRRGQTCVGDDWGSVTYGYCRNYTY